MDHDNTVAAVDGPTLAGSAPARPGELARGALVGRYVLVDELGAGGMGVVYAAYDPELGRRVALKLLLSRGDGTPGGAGRTRLLREAQALARLAHPNVVTVHDVGTHGDEVWIAMEFVAGRTLGAWAAAQPRRWSEVLRVLTDVARGIAAAHAVGLVHRDLKPDNVMIGDDGRVRVMDFGLAHGRASAATEPELSAPRDPAPPDLSALSLRLTAAGSIQGTPAYMAPEQWHGDEARPATDQFGWSVMAWELLYGERPFAGDTLETIATATLAGRRRPPPRGKRVPGWLRRVIERGLAVDPARRWPTTAALLAALERGRTRTRVRTALLVLAGLAAIAGVLLAAHRRDLARRVATCEAAGREIDAAWDPAARDRLRGAFIATHAPDAAATAERVLPWLDRYAAAWTRARVDACHHADVEHLWPPKISEPATACLDDRRLEFAGLVAELTRAGPTVLQRAVPAAASLGSIDDCIDEGLLLRLPAPPGDQQPAIQAARADVSRARSLALTGDYAAALALATRTREAQDANGWPPAWAAARALEANVLEKTGAYEPAAAAAAEAYFAAAKSGAWQVAVEAASRLILIEGYFRAHPDDGRAWARHAEVAIGLAGDRVGLAEARRLSFLALVQDAAGAYDEAQALHRRSLAAREQALGPSHPDVASSLADLAAVLATTGAYAEARPLAERALAIREAAFGPDHPTVAASLDDLAGIDKATGAYADARALHERALAIQERALGPDHPSVAVSLNNLANVHAALDDHAGAAALYRRALAIQERALGPDHPSVATTLGNLAGALVTLGLAAEARELGARALAIDERALGPDHPNVALRLTELATAVAARGESTAAVPLLTRALAIQEKSLGPDHPEVAWTLASLGDVHRAAGDHAAARPLFERALAEIQEKALGPDHADLAVTLSHLADALAAAGAADQAEPLHRRALKILEASFGPDDARVHAARAALAPDTEPSEPDALIVSPVITAAAAAASAS